MEKLKEQLKINLKNNKKNENLKEFEDILKNYKSLLHSSSSSSSLLKQHLNSSHSNSDLLKERLEELKFTHKLNSLAIKRQSIPNLQVTNNSFFLFLALSFFLPSFFLSSFEVEKIMIYS